MPLIKVRRVPKARPILMNIILMIIGGKSGQAIA